MTVRPLISVIMPVRNGEAYVEAAVRSILAQTIQDFELIAIDDGSTDGTRRILAGLSERDKRLRVRSRPSLGLVAALEDGRGEARADLLARMDADDIARPDRLARQVEFLACNPDVVCVGGQVRKIDSEGRRLRIGAFPIRSDACRAYLAFGSPLCHPATTMRADAVARIGGYRALYRHAEDYDLWLRLATLGELANLDAVVLDYRVHAEGVTARFAARQAISAALAFVESRGGLTAEDAARVAGRVDAEEREARDAASLWGRVERELPAALRLQARAAFFRALILNGGIADPAAVAALQATLPELAAEARARGEEPVLSFALVRAVYQLAHNGMFREAASLAAEVIGRLPLPVAHELVAIARDRLRPRARLRRSV